MPSKEFFKAVDDISKLTTTPSSSETLQLYGLYKQAIIGDNDTPKPGALDFKAQARWDAWTKLKGTSEEDAERQYIALVKSIVDPYSLDKNL